MVRKKLTQGNDSEVFAHPDQPPLVHCILAMLGQQAVISGRWNEEAAVLQMHLSVLQQVVEYWQHVALHLLDALQHQDAAQCGCLDGRLVEIGGRPGSDLSPLFEVCLGRVTRQRHVLHLALGELKVLLSQEASLRPGASQQKDVLTQQVWGGGSVGSHKSNEYEDQ